MRDKLYLILSISFLAKLAEAFSNPTFKDAEGKVYGFSCPDVPSGFCVIERQGMPYKVEGYEKYVSIVEGCGANQTQVSKTLNETLASVASCGDGAFSSMVRFWQDSYSINKVGECIQEQVSAYTSSCQDPSSQDSGYILGGIATAVLLLIAVGIVCYKTKCNKNTSNSSTPFLTDAERAQADAGPTRGLE